VGFEFNENQVANVSRRRTRLCGERDRNENGYTPAMIKVRVFYPSSDGARFDMEYYGDRHMPMVQAKLGAACKGIAVEHGVACATPGSRPQFMAMGRRYFDSLEEFQNELRPTREEFVADVPNYTNVQPVIQINEVVVALEPVAAREHA
jgi:uncharacterized protein (TIGR02118 family)